MPCPADYGYAFERLLLGRPYHAAHPRFTDKVYVHVPPRFTVRIAGSFCQQVKRITRLFNGFIIRFCRLAVILPFSFEGKGMGKREIEEA